MAASGRRSPPFDRSGIRGQEMLQLMRLGVVPFGTILLALASADEPELNALDLPMLNPDIATLRRTVTLWRPRIETLLRERYGIRLLAVYTYPAQVMFCQQAFTGLGDLAGRRVRVSSVGQSELIEALGATPVVTPFAEIVPAIRGGVVQCAITGTLSGNAIGVHEVTDACLARRHQLGRLHLRRQRARLGGAARGRAGGAARRARHAAGGYLARRRAGDGGRAALQCRPAGLRRRRPWPDDDRRGPAAGPRPAAAIADRCRAARLGAALRQRMRRDLEPDHGPGPRHPGEGGLSACRRAASASPSRSPAGWSC